MNKLQFIGFVCFLFIGIGSVEVMAQRGPGQGAGQERSSSELGSQSERLEAARVAFFTNRLALNAEQASRFWPLYNTYQEQRNAEIREIRALTNRNPDKLTEKEIDQVIERKLQHQQTMQTLEINFMQQMQEVLDPKQRFILMGINRDFMRHLSDMQRRGRGRE
ncbi:MAG: Spy/CpxP family protein refolding chaperone [Nitritalea sp.]